MWMNLATPSMLSYWNEVSERATAALALVVPQDLVNINKYYISKVIQKFKILRRRRKIRSEVSKTFDITSLDTLFALYFDGRKDRTICQVKEREKFHRPEV